MVNGTAVLVVDLGNSETRVITKFGTTQKGNPRWKLRNLSNRYNIIPDSKVDQYLTGGVYTSEKSKIFNMGGTYYSSGELCDVEFGSTAVRPTALEKKYDSLVSKLTLNTAFCVGYEMISEMTNSDMSSVCVEWDVVLLLPPDDIELGAKKLADMVRSITQVNFKMPELSKEVKVNKVNIFPEGFAALISVLFESKNKVREEYKYLLEPDVTTLICDIGAGTTDFVLARGSNVVSSSRFTREIGGNNVHQRVRRLLKERGIALSDSAVRLGCERGYVKSGASKKSIIDELSTAKRDVSRQLVDAVQEFFENNMMPILGINNILVVGGGAESSEEKGIDPISMYIIDFMKRLSPDINLVEIPEVEIDGVTRRSPRLLNIIGAAILAG